MSVVKTIDLRRYDVTLVSPRNHFLFTPLLPSSTVGTVEFRSIIEPVRKAAANTRRQLSSLPPSTWLPRIVECSAVKRLSKRFAVNL